MTDEAYDAQLLEISEIMKADMWMDSELELQRRYSSPLHLWNILFGAFAWAAVMVILLEAFRP